MTTLRRHQRPGVPGNHPGLVRCQPGRAGHVPGSAESAYGRFPPSQACPGGCGPIVLFAQGSPQGLTRTAGSCVNN
jgi:hypothetical protein